jgi:hypothetical protein
MIEADAFEVKRRISFPELSHPFMKNFLRTVCSILLVGTAVERARANSVVLPPDINHSALHQAAEKCEASKAREALKALAPAQRQKAINLLDREGYAPLGYAARAGCLEVVKLLVEAGATIDISDGRGGWTPLLQAADQRHADVVRYLLDHGANPNTKTRIGKTPLSVALVGSAFSYGPKGNRDATLKALLEKNADPSPLLAAYAELQKGVREQENQIEELQAACRRLEGERQRLSEILDKIRAEAGNREPRPL